MTTAILIISLFFFMLSMIMTTITWLCCGSMLKVMREIQETEKSAKERHANSFVQGLMPKAWLDKHRIDN